MKNSPRTTVERIVGKIDNDFNPSNSDWVPRVGAWCFDALSQLKCLPKEYKTRRLQVIDKIATFPCTIESYQMKVFDEYGCEIPELKNKCCGGNNTKYIQEQIGLSQVSDDVSQRTIVVDVINPRGKNYVIVGDDKIELNFDAEFIDVKSLEVLQYYSEVYNCNLPYIIDDGLLIEALTQYCIYKMLCRGDKHPVFNLTSNDATNPYRQWDKLKSQAAASVKILLMKDSNINMWNNFFFNSTFLPRD